MVFTMSCPKEFYFRLISSGDVNTELLNFAAQAKHQRWLIHERDWETSLTTPLGFNLSLNYLTR
jgi:hypothetical protein